MKKILYIVFINYLFSAILYIPADFSTIQEGIDNSNTGDTLSISQGRYHEHLNISNKTLTLMSQYLSTGHNFDITQTTIMSANDPVISISNNSNVSIIGLSISSNLNGITIDNSELDLKKTVLFNAYNQDSAINLSNNANVSITQCTIYGSEYTINGNNSHININSSILWPYNKVAPIDINLYQFNISYSCAKDNPSNASVSNSITQNPFTEFGNAAYYPSMNHDFDFSYVNQYPWIGNPGARYDGKDNNPWRYVLDQSLIWATTNDGRDVRIGDGEPNDTGDPDGDGVMGEDWYNGYDDDLDGLIDEDYFTADGIDNDGDCIGDTNLDGCVCCGFKDENGNGIYDIGEPFGGYHGDSDINGYPAIDENIDTNEDRWYDGYDNDGNNEIDDTQEQDTGGIQPNWAYNLVERQILIFYGREHEYLGSEPFDDYGNDGFDAQGDPNLMDPDGSEFNGICDPGEMSSLKDLNGDGEWTQGTLNPWYIQNAIDKHVRGDWFYDQDTDTFYFDVYLYDFGIDREPGDQWTDVPGGEGLIPTEGNNNLLDGTAIPFEGCIDNNNDGFCNNFLVMDPNSPDYNPDGVDIFIDGQGFNPYNFHDCGLDGECEFLYTDTNFIDLDGDGIPTADEVLAFEEQLAIDENYCTCTLPGFGCAFWQNPCSSGIITLENPNWDGADAGEANGQWDSFDYNYGLQNENDCNTQGGIWYGNPDNPNDLALCGDGVLDPGDEWIDVDGDGMFNSDYDTIFDTYPYADGVYDPNWDIHNDCGQDGLCPGDFGYIGPDPGEADGVIQHIDDKELDEEFDTGDGDFNSEAEELTNDFNNDGVFTCLDPNDINSCDEYIDSNEDGTWTPADYTPTWRNSDNYVSDQILSYYEFSSLIECGESNNDFDYISDFDGIDNDGDSDDYIDLNGNGIPDPGDYNPLTAGPDGIFGTVDDYMNYSTGVNPDGYVFADGKDNDGDAQDIDNDGYPYFQEIRQGTDPMDGNDIPLDINGNPMPQANSQWGVDELIDENFCDNPEEYIGLVSAEYFSGYSFGSSSFNISPISPALDSGDPNLPLDEDGSDSDMGALYSFHPYYGCTDPDAYNYNLFVVEDDGSCQYDYSELTNGCLQSPLIGANGNPIMLWCLDFVDGVDNDYDWSSATHFPFFENNAWDGDGDPSSQCDVYSASCFNISDDPIYNIDTDNDGTEDAFDWSLLTDMNNNGIWEGFGWADDGEGETPGQWGFVDYIKCEDNTYSGLYISCNGHLNPTTGEFAVSGDTIGITLYHPEDVLHYNNGNLSMTTPNVSNYWQNVGIDEFSIFNGLAYIPIIPDVEFIEYLPAEEMLVDNGNNIFDEYYYDADLDSLIEETFIDEDGDGNYDMGGWRMNVSWDNYFVIPMINIDDEFYPINTQVMQIENNFLQEPPIIVDMNTESYELFNMPKNAPICTRINYANNSYPYFLQPNMSGCIMSPDFIGDDLDTDISLPEEYHLYPNYPNPFNPTTTIKYSLPEYTRVHIMIFDIRGRKVTDLYKGYQTQGNYNVQWDASRYASGVYFLNIRTDNFVKTQKMTLIK